MKTFTRQPFQQKMLRAVGPGTLAMLIGMLCFVGWQLFAPRKIQIEHKVQTSDGKTLWGSPSPSEFLSWTHVLGLTEQQVAKLEQIALDEKKKMAPVDEQIKEEMDKFDRWIRTEQNHGLAEIQLASQPLARLSWKKRALSWTYAKLAANVLTPSQKAKVQSLRATRKSLGASSKEQVHGD